MGESGSGKSTICEKLRLVAEKYDMPVEIMSTDNYFNDISKYVDKHGNLAKALQAEKIDLDNPASQQLDIMKEDLKKLSNGEDIRSPKYHMNGSGISEPKAIPVKAKKIIVVEGIACAYDGSRELFDAKIFVEVDD